MKISKINNYQTQNKSFNKTNMNFGAFKTNSQDVLDILKKRGIEFYPGSSKSGKLFFTRNDLNTAILSSIGEENYLKKAMQEAKILGPKSIKNLLKASFEDLIFRLDSSEV